MICLICGRPTEGLICSACAPSVLEKHNIALKEKSSPTETKGVESPKLPLDKEDIIGHPNHYCKGRKYEPKDVIRDWDLNFNLGNAVKYISRNGRKDGNSALQDLKKARQYLDFEIAYLEKEE